MPDVKALLPYKKISGWAQILPLRAATQSPYRRDGRELSLPMVLAIVRPRSSKAGLVTANDHVGAAGEWGL
jgi:hypothetical protein